MNQPITMSPGASAREYHVENARTLQGEPEALHAEAALADFDALRARVARLEAALSGLIDECETNDKFGEDAGEAAALNEARAALERGQA